uniref:Trigger factor ribosome-binding bacterial domain-containing protein n=1 Tax=Entomoneis paludosa TaxID=265537 RepID=A0A7S2VB02_9STRA|mmetsp:Transcript_15156/g.31242  ORF Transcript_15156/g.31242 Transcript_15156/m.31242 type:complete len:216 (+) Transcript_15156:59-706(+)
MIKSSMMKILAVIALMTTASQGFTAQRVPQTSCGALGMVVEAFPEPEGGVEVSPVGSSLPGSRVKQMEELKGVKSDLGTPYEFWLTAEVDGTLVKEVRTTILKDASKKANFPGFRKGQVPPYALPKMTTFAVQEAIIKTVQAVVDCYGLKELEGDDGKVEVKEDLEDICKGYNVGDPFQITATINAAYDPAKQPAVSEEEEVIDAEVVEEKVNES